MRCSAADFRFLQFGVATGDRARIQAPPDATHRRDRDQPNVTSQTFRNDAQSVRAARRFVHDLLDEVGIDPETATLLTSELASNVVQHACTDFDLVVTIDDTTVHIEIHDGIAISEAFRDLITNPPTEVNVTSANGRGILLLGSSQVRFGLTDKGHGGKAVWFDIPRAGTFVGPIAMIHDDEFAGRAVQP